MIFVADASAIGAALLPDEGGPMAALVLRLSRERTIVAPVHWPLELASLIMSAHRRRRIDDQQHIAALEAADALIREARIVQPPAPSELARVARGNGLSIYDAAYLSACLDLNAPLLTGDGPLRRAGAVNDVELLEP